MTIGGVFVIVGLVLSYFLVWKPVAAMVAARSWVATPCVITGSTVERHGSSRSGARPSYDWFVNYQYEAEGRKIIRDRWSFWPRLQGRENAQEKRAARYPKGMQTTCYYNPAAPDEAVLDRGLTYAAMLLFVPLVAVALGGIAIAAEREEG
jgi:hypothetical protein